MSSNFSSVALELTINFKHFGIFNSKILFNLILRLVGIRPHVFQGFPPILLFNDCLHTYLWIDYRPLWIIPRRVQWFDISVGTTEVNYQTHRHFKGWSASGPIFIRGSPISLFNDCLHTYLCIFYRPLWIISRRVKWLYFSVGTMEVNHQSHGYPEGRSSSRPMFIRGFPLYGYLTTLHTYFCPFYRPLWLILPRVKSSNFSVSTMEVKHQTHR